MAVFANTLTLDVTGFLKGVKTALGITEKISKGIDAKADIDIAVHDAEVDKLKHDVAALDGKNIDVKVKVDDSEVDKANAKAKGASSGIGGSIAGLAVGGAAIAGVALLSKELVQGALAGDDLGDSLEVAFSQAGVADVGAAIKQTTEANLSLANSLGQNVARVDELSLAAAGLSGASGSLNTDMTKAALGIETLSGGAVKGEAVIKALSRGLQDPEGAAAIDALAKKYPQLADELRGTGTAAQKLAAINKELGPTFATLEQQAQGPDAVLKTLQNTLSRTFQEAGAQVFEAITPIAKVLGEILPPLLQSLGPALGGIIQSIAPLLSGLATQLGPVIKIIGDTLVPVIASLAAGLMPIIEALFPALITILGALGPTLVVIANVVGSVVGALGKGLAPILGTVANVIAQVLVGLSPLLAALGDILPPIIEALLQPIGELLAALLPLIPVIIDVLVPIITVLARILGVVLVGAVKLLTPVINILTKIIEFVVGLVQKGVEFFGNLFESFASGSGATGALGSAFQKVGEIIQTLIASLPDWVKDILGMNDATAEAAATATKAADATGELTAEQKKLNAENEKGNKIAKTGAGTGKSSLTLAQEQLKAAIAKRAEDLDALVRANRRLVLDGKLTKAQAESLEATKRQENAEANRLDTITKLGLVLDASGNVLKTTLRLSKDESLTALKSQLSDVIKQVDDSEFGVLQIDATVKKDKITASIAKTIEETNNLLSAKFFTFDDELIARFTKQGIDGIESFRQSFESKIASVDSSIADLRAIASKQTGDDQIKTLADIAKLEDARVQLRSRSGEAEKKIINGVTEAMSVQYGVSQALGEILAGFKITIDTEDANESLEKTKELITGVNKEFDAGTLSYQSGLDKLKDVGDQTSSIFERLSKAIGESLKSVSDGLESSALKASESSGAIGTVVDLMAVSVGASFASMVASGENVWVAIASSAFDGLQALIPIFSAQILAGSLATPQSILTAGGAGLTQWAAMTALIQVAVSAARAGLGFRGGGYTGDGDPSSIAGHVHKREWVAREGLTREYRDLFEHLDANKPLEQFPEIKAMLVAAGTDGATTPSTMYEVAPVSYIAPDYRGDNVAGVKLDAILEQLQGMEVIHKEVKEYEFHHDADVTMKAIKRKTLQGLR